MLIVLKRILLWVGFAFVLSEILLRFTGHQKTYTEINGGEYLSMYGQEYPTEHWLHTPNTTNRFNGVEFDYEHAINSQGFREKELATRSDSTRLVITLGDSFTEGVGAPYDSTWPRFIERRLNEQSDEIKTVIYNAGIMGSDPFYQFKLFEDKLSKLNPEIVIVALNRGDFQDDYFYRGGFSRFRNGKVITKESPWYEPLFRISHVVRFFVNEVLAQGGYLLGAQERRQLTIEGLDSVNVALRALNSVAVRNGARMLVVYYQFPVDYCQNHEEEAYILEGLDKWGPYKNLDLSKRLSAALYGQDCESYHWPKDKHFNSRGYEIMADAIYHEAEAKYPGFWGTKGD